jgi:1,4-dihydroxy-2-naphthoate octaprenyltransferase
MSQSPLSVWIMASRPKTLPAALAPVLIGSAMALADGATHLWSALAAAGGALLIQIGTNFTNDYLDFKKGVDQSDRLGPTRVTQAGLVTPNAMQRAIVIAFGLAFMLGIYLVYRGGWPIVIIGLSSITFGVLYTAGRFSLSRTGLADLFVLIFFGPVAVGGTYYVQVLQIDGNLIIAGLAPGLFSMAILTVNNLRDIDTDTRAGKRTLPVRWGRTFARIEYVTLVILASLVPLILTLRTHDHYFSLTAILVIPAALPTIRTVFTSVDGPTLNVTLASTGRLLLLYAVIFSVGWIL